MITMILGALKGSADGWDMRKSKVDGQTMDRRLKASSDSEQIGSKVGLCFVMTLEPLHLECLFALSDCFLFTFEETEAAA